MISLGLFALGLFVGGIVSYVMLKSTEMTLGIAVTGVIGAAISGAPISFAKVFVPDSMIPALAAYPLGLAVALMSVFLTFAQDNIAQTGVENRVLGRTLLGVAHVVGAAVVYALLVCILFDWFGLRESLGALDAAFLAQAAQSSRNGGT